MNEVKSAAKAAMAPWRAAPRLRRLTVVAVAATIAALTTRQAALLLLAAPALAALAAAGRPRGPATMEPAVELSAARCFEGEDVEVTVTVRAPGEEVRFHLTPGPAILLQDGAATQVVVGESAATARWLLRPAAWGRRVPAAITIGCRQAGMWQADLTVRPGVLEVFPHPPAARAGLLPPVLLRRIGEHRSRAPGGGVEFAGIREYRQGDRLRDVNWRVSSRRGQVQVNQRAAERAADLVVVVDAFSQAGPPGEGALELAVRGAAGLAHAYLSAGDRVGAVALGGMLRWLAPAPGDLQFYRIAELVSDIRYDSAVTPDLDRIPRPAMPPGTLAVMFTPLLDPRAMTAVADLRGRGVSLVVVDVLRHEPPADTRLSRSRLALRLWRLDRAGLHASLARMGVPVLCWEDGADLDTALTPLHARPLPAVRP